MKFSKYYNTQGLTTEVHKAGYPVVKMFYNERGQRIKKESYNTALPFSIRSTDYYALDISGNAMAIYTKIAGGTTVQNELPIYGLSRLGVFMKTTVPTNNYTNYQITDHLGNVRAIIKKIASNPNFLVYSYADYYPFGMPMPNKQITDNNYRYGFQGQELDTETNMEAFQLRLWDGRLGRWLTVDPKHQYASPYLGMGNNPISRIDPDGGTDAPPTDWVDKNGNLIYSDGNPNGDVYIVNDGYEFNGNVKELTSNSKMLYDNWKLVGYHVEAFDYVVSVAKNQGVDLENADNYFLKSAKGSGYKEYLEAGNGADLLKQKDGTWNIKPKAPNEWTFTVGLGDKKDKTVIFANYNNLVNSIEHEKRHFMQYSHWINKSKEKTLNTTPDAIKRTIELDAIKYQRSHTSWKNTTKSYKKTIMSYENQYR